MNMKTIIVIDDDVGLLKMIEIFLNRTGHRVILAEDGKKGIEYFDSERSVDVVVTDLNMPRLDGNGVARHIRSSPKSGTRILAVTGNRHLIRSELFDGVLDKPFDLNALSDFIDAGK